MCLHVLSKDELVKFNVKALRTSVSERDGQKVRQMMQEARKILPAIQKMACEVGRYKRALLREGRGPLRPLNDVTDREERTIKPVMIFPRRKI